MKQLLLSLIACSIVSAFALSACEKKQELTQEQIKINLKKIIPELPNDLKINKSPIENVYEVNVGRKIFYITNNGKYLVFGNIIDIDSKQNLTEKRIQELSKIDWNKLPLDKAIKIVNGNGSKKLAVFSDPECPYCKLFEKQVVSQLKDTTIYIFLFPLPMHANAKPDAARIWCSKDRAATWTKWMRDGVALPADTKCDTSALDDVYKFGTDIVQIDGTPTLILANGQVLPGALPAEQLMQAMDKSSS